MCSICIIIIIIPGVNLHLLCFFEITFTPRLAELSRHQLIATRRVVDQERSNHLNLASFMTRLSHQNHHAGPVSGHRNP